MELKVGDKVKTTREITFVSGEILPKGSTLTYECRVDYLNANFLKDENGTTTVLKDGDFELVKEETIKLNKIKMVIGENRVVECGEYKVEWNYKDDYKKDGDISSLSISNNSKCIFDIYFKKYDYHQQMEITNLILDKLGLNVELVEDDDNEVLEQIDKLEAELEKLRGMIK